MNFMYLLCFAADWDHKCLLSMLEQKKKHAFATVTTIAAVEAVTWPQSRMALESRLRCFLHGLHGLLARCCLGCRLGSTAYRPGELSLVPLRGVGGDGEPQVRAPRTTKTHWSRMAILT